MVDVETLLAKVLAEHRLIGVKGGTAAGSRWICDCSAEGRTPGTRDYAERLHAEHVATRQVFALRSDETLIEQVAEAIHAGYCCDGLDPGECSRSGRDIAAARAAVAAMFGEAP